MKTGIVDVGGGYRGIYAAGVLDYCMNRQIGFDVGIGVSAGSANLISYAAGQAGRNYKFYTEYGLRKEYAGPKLFLTKKTFIDLDYAYSTLSNSDGEYPLDYPAFADSAMDFYVVATEADTGKVRYFSKSDIRQDHYDAMKASCAIPLVCHPYEVNGKQYFDGALSDPVPVKKALELGCDRVILLLTKPKDFIRTPNKDERIARMIRHEFPQAARCLEQRAEHYNKSVADAKRLEAEGKVLIVAPDDTCGVDTLTRDTKRLTALYEKGYADGAKIEAFLKKTKAGTARQEEKE